MAFTRAYGHQGDPFPRRTMRAGALSRRPVPTPMHLAPHGRKSRAKLQQLRVAQMRRTLAAGDPFRFRMPKFVRKLSLKKVVSGVGKLAKVALPVAATVFTGGLGGAALGLASGLIGRGGGAEPPPETFAPEMVGTPGQVAAGDMSPPGDYDDFSEDVEDESDDEYADDDYGDMYDEG